MTLKRGVAGYHAWQKAIIGDDMLRKIAQRDHYDIRVIAFAITIHGQNGRGCFATAATIASLVGCSRQTAEDKRRELVNLGWLTIVDRRGGYNKRGITVDISLPPTPAPW